MLEYLKIIVKELTTVIYICNIVSYFLDRKTIKLFLLDQFFIMVISSIALYIIDCFK